jgi:hypothetical protein
MKKLILTGAVCVLLCGIALAYCYVDPTCSMNCQRRCFANDPSGNCIQYCNNVCQMCQ